MELRTPLISIIALKEDALLPAIFNPVRIKNCLKRTSAIKVATEKLQMISVTNGSHYVPTTKSTLFVVSKDVWDTKEDTGKSMKNAQRYGKKHLSG